MLKLNRKLEYALIALKHMSTNAEKLVSAKEISNAYNTPFDPTARVLQIMAQNEILLAEQGVRGGYRLIKDLSEISIKKLSDMITGPITVTKCVHSKALSKCDISANCKIIEPMVRLNKKIDTVFNEIKISELINT